MSDTWQHQVRIHVDETGRALLGDPEHNIHAVLCQHDAVLASQLDAFEHPADSHGNAPAGIP